MRGNYAVLGGVRVAPISVASSRSFVGPAVILLSSDQRADQLATVN